MDAKRKEQVKSKILSALGTEDLPIGGIIAGCPRLRCTRVQVQRVLREMLAENTIERLGTSARTMTYRAMVKPC